MSDRVVELDQFANVMEGMLNELQVGINHSVETAVTEGSEKAKEVVRKKAKGQFKNQQPLAKGRYYTGFDFKIDVKNERSVIGEVGNKKYPGLVHLLEKGHATLGGGRVAGHPHMIDGFNEGSRVYEERLDELIDRNLRSL